MSQDLINSIRDIKTKPRSEMKIEEVHLRHPHPRELLDGIIEEMNRDGYSGRFENADQIHSYLHHLLEVMHRREHHRTPEIDYVTLRCSCGSVHKLTIEPSPRNRNLPYYDPRTGRRGIGYGDMTREYESFVRFYCTTCGIQIRTMAKKIRKVETQETDEYKRKIHDDKSQYPF